MLDEAAQTLNASPYKDLNRGIKESDAVVVATDTRDHLRIAKMAANAGKHLFFEKPLANHRDGVTELKEKIEKIEKKNLICEVSCHRRCKF